jgi:uncharacterized membrane protein YecN with MAPEG domain
LLSTRVIQKRRGARVGLGDGGDGELLQRVCVHANFAEYVPLTLLLITLAESLKTDARMLHDLGIALVVAGSCMRMASRSQTGRFIFDSRCRSNQHGVACGRYRPHSWIVPTKHWPLENGRLVGSFMAATDFALLSGWCWIFVLLYANSDRIDRISS